MRFHTLLPSLALAGVLAPDAAGQIPQLIPHSRTMDLLVVDTSYDGIWRLSDQNQNGTYDPGEITSFYSDVIGAFAWTSPSCITVAANGTVFVGDVSTDTIYALRDQNGDGDANDPGEHRVYFDLSNAGGLTMHLSHGVTVDALGRVFVAVANQSSPVGSDKILKLADQTGDGDANDLGEAIDYYVVPASSGSLAVSIPTKLAVGHDFSLYFTDVGTSAGQRGVWRLSDNNANGHCNDPGEAALYWNPSTGNAQYWSLAIDRTGVCYVTDHNSEQIWRGFDADASNTITASEQTLYYQTSGSTWWDLVMRDDGAILVCETQTPDRLTALRDLDSNGNALGVGEATDAYNSTLPGTVAVAPRGAALFRAPVFDPIAPVQIGQTTPLNLNAVKPGDLCVSVFSIGLGLPFPLAPWGTVEVDISQFVVFGFGVADPTGTFAHSFTAPNTPSAVGSYAFQGLCGDNFRLFLSNAVPLSITP